jgi:DNA-binding transcriptional LysR family regulator
LWGRRLRRLETRVGNVLFEQTREGQILTEAGEAMLAEVEAMDLAASRLTESASSGRGLSGTLRVSLSEGFGTWFVAPNLQEFTAAHSELTVDLVASSGFLSPSKREADLAVVLSRPRTGAVIAGKLTDYRLRLYASPSYLASAGSPHTSDDLHSHRLVGYIPDLLYDPALRYLAEFHPDLTASIRSSSINAQHRLIAAGAGIGVLPCFIGGSDPSLVSILPDRSIIRSFWLVTHRDTCQLARIRSFKHWLEQVVTRRRDQIM